MYDLVIKGGTVVDGTGTSASYTADVAVTDGRIVEIGAVSGAARQTIDAHGAIVTPGFVDVHTHYDGQATWDHQLAPSCWHGVTTAILGNCGVGFAPARRDRHDFLVQLMEGVEDIPGTALHEGLTWTWESFPEYLDELARLPRLLDVGTHIPHGSLRAYVMDERGAANEPATADDIAAMAAIVEEATRAGALGFATNRLPSHTAKDGRSVPGTFADADELMAIGRAMKLGGGGVVEVVSAESMGMVPGGYEHDIEWTARLSIETGQKITFCLTQIDNMPDRWRDALAMIDDANARGAQIVVQTAGRPLGILVGLTTKHQFTGRPSFDEVADLPLAQLVAALRDPARRARILSETSAVGAGIGRFVSRMADKAWPLDDPPNYEPHPDDSIGAMAKARGVEADEIFYDLFLQHDGRQLVLFTLGGYANRNTDHIVELLSHPSTILGLADGGAHVSLICDGSTSTSLLSYYVRDRKRTRLSLETAVNKMTLAPAALYGLRDRGILAPGYKADLNVIDFDRLHLKMPEVVADLPTGARRVLQRAAGYVATIVSGKVTLRGGDETGERPGVLVRRA